MFNKKTKIISWFLILAAVFLFAVPGKAVGGASTDKPTGDSNEWSAEALKLEEELVCGILKDYRNVSPEITEKLNWVLANMETERPYWVPYLSGEFQGKPSSQGIHPELYYLWLIQKLDLIFDVFEGDYIEDEVIEKYLDPFADALFLKVQKLNKTASNYFNRDGLSVEEIRNKMVGPGFGLHALPLHLRV